MMVVPLVEPIGSFDIIFPPSTYILVPIISSLVLVVISNFDTAEIDANASPLKPREYKSYKSSIFLILLVACLKNDFSTSLEGIPIPLSVILIRLFPPSIISMEILFAPASMEFSISSFTTEEGLSTTSPAAILFIVKSSRMLIIFFIFTPLRFYFFCFSLKIIKRVYSI